MLLHHNDDTKLCLHDFGSLLYYGANSNKDKITRKTPRHICIPINLVRVVTNGSNWLCFIIFTKGPKETEKKKRKEQKIGLRMLSMKTYFTIDTLLFLMADFFLNLVEIERSFIDRRKINEKCKEICILSVTSNYNVFA